MKVSLKKKSKKKLVKYEELIENEINKVKNSDKMWDLIGHTSSVSSVAISQDGK